MAGNELSLSILSIECIEQTCSTSKSFLDLKLVKLRDNSSSFTAPVYTIASTQECSGLTFDQRWIDQWRVLLIVIEELGGHRQLGILH